MGFGLLDAFLHLVKALGDVFLAQRALPLFGGRIRWLELSLLVLSLLLH